MSKRNKKAQANSTAVAVIEDDANGSFQEAVQNAIAESEGDGGTEVIEAGDTEVVAEPVVDDEVLALLAEDNTATEATTTEPEITADDVDEPTDGEVLAAIDGASSIGASGKKRAPKTPAAPMREFTAVAQIDQATLDANLAGCNAKKVREKADNLIAAVTHGKKLSGYTKHAVSELLTNGRISGKSMTERFRTEGLSEGTARAQAQQMTALFKLVGAVTPDATNPRELVIQDNDLVQELAKIAA